MSRNDAWTTLARVVLVLMLSAGLGASAVGLIALMVGPSSGEGPPTCDGQVMHPGDRCWEEFNGQITVVTYEEIMRREESGQGQQQVLTVGGISLGGGAVLSLGSWWILRRTGPGK